MFAVCEENGCSNKGRSDSEALSALKEILPKSYSHTVCNCKGSADSLEATFRVNVTSREEFDEWKASFHESSKTTLRLKRSRPRLGSKVVYRAEYKCQHNTQPRSSTADARRGSKNTNCPAILDVTIFNSTKQQSKSSDVHRQDFLGQMCIKFCHNHPVHAASALKHRDVSQDTKLRIEQLLLQGYTPAAALEIFKYDLQMEHPDEYVYISGDRNRCPDRDFVYRLYYKLCQERYGNNIGKSGVTDLKEFVNTQNAFFGDTPNGSTAAEATTLSHPKVKSNQYVSMSACDDNQIVVAVCTPLMYRVHRLVKHSAEMVFVDATGNLDRSNCRVFLLLTHSCVGGLPLGVLITTSEAQSTVKSALQLFSHMVGDVAFFGRGSRGPVIFMTDDSRSERAALKEVFPESAQLLCAFHVLQAFWRYVWDSKNGIPRSDRPHVFGLVKDMVYSTDVRELKVRYEAAIVDAVLGKYPKVLAYIDKMFERKELWALCHRDQMLVRGNNTNNFCETAMRVLKDQILNRTKAFNTQQLIDFISTRMEKYYERRCVDVANNVLCRVQQSRYLLHEKVSADQIARVSEFEFEVKSSSDPSNMYTVDMSVGLCTCKVGCTGGPCKHQAGIVSTFGVRSWNFIPEADPTMRQLLCHVGTGTLHDETWFLPLVKKHSSAVSTCSSTTNSGNTIVTKPAGEDNNVLASPADAPCPLLPDGNASLPSTSIGSALVADLKAFVGNLESSLSRDPDTYEPAVRAFIRSIGKMNTESHLVSALHTFGKYSGVAKLASNKRIGVQPTAVQRRQRPMPGFRQKGIGRPNKVLASSQTVNVGPQKSRKRQGEGIDALSGAQLPKRRKAPHSLSRCVAENTSLGKTHSQK